VADQVSCLEAIALICDRLKLLPNVIYPTPEAQAQTRLLIAHQKGDVPITLDAKSQQQLAKGVECASTVDEKGYLLSTILIGHGRVSRTKLMRWLQQKAPSKAIRKRQSRRKVRRFHYPEDKALREEFRRLLKDGISKSEAARRLALKSRNGTVDQRVARFRKFR
jgi:hypothetical protein